MKTTIFVLSILLSCFSFAAKPEKGKKKESASVDRPSREKMLKKFDADGDGKLNAEEKAEVLKKMNARKKEMVSAFDKDGDGKLNEEERKTAMASRSKNGKSKKGSKGKKERKKKGEGKKKKDS